MRIDKRQSIIILLILMLAAVICAACIKIVIEPVDLSSKEAVEVSIAQGMGTGEIAGILKSKGLIASEFAFKLYVKITGWDGELKFGKYDISKSEGLGAIIEKLALGHQKGIMLGIPEGYTAKQIAARAASLSLADYDEFMGLVNNPTEELYKIVPFSFEGSLEGYLYPDTYEFSEGAGAKAVIVAMLSNFASKVGNRIAAELKLGLSPSQVIVLASIVEKEALLASELPIVAGVFLNRLDRRMALQSCATVQYLLPEPKPVLSKQDTLIESPYNTYLINGLPPGPISNPGEAAVLAVLNPQKHDYLFFVANDDGSHSFSRTYSEHLRAKFGN
jgi:UPF0755 protein